MKQIISSFFIAQLRPTAYMVLFVLAVSVLAEDNSPPIHITADQAQSANANISRADGNVIFKRGDLRADAQWARYDHNTTELWAGDTVTVAKTGDVVIGKTLDVITHTYKGKLDQAIYFLRNQFGRGDAARLLFAGEDKYVLEKGRFTTCDPGDDSWYIRGSDISLDFIQHQGVARHTVFEFKGVPLLYTPWMNFPLDRNRQSGLLAPIFGTNSKSGTQFGLPIYWNIAPNYDATITPQIYTKRGAMLGGEFRYLQPYYQGNISAEVLPYDRQAQQHRYSWKLQHQHTLSSRLYFSAHLEGVSDENYFTDLSNTLQVSSSTNLPRDIIFSYNSGSWWNASLRSLQYQTLQTPSTTITKPYSRLPQITFNGSPPTDNSLIIDIVGEFNRFEHPTLTTGNRLIGYPSLGLPYEKSYGFIRPKIGLHATSYTFDTHANQLNQKYNRILPIASLDAGLIFERDFTLAKQEMAQTLEPRIYYLYVPYQDQSKLPNFDSADVDFNFAQMFSENQFSGGDRINNANQLTTAITTRFYENETGLERLRLGVGQRFYFADQKVTVSASPRPIEQTRSDIIMQASSQLWRNIGVGGLWQYKVEKRQTNKANVELVWNPGSAKTLNLRYRFDRTNPEQLRQLDLSGQWPIARGWYAVGRYNYSLQDKKALDAIAGLQYNAGCWGIQFVIQRYITDNNHMNTSFYIMLDLRGFNGIGDNPMRILQDRIPGYSKIN